MKSFYEFYRKLQADKLFEQVGGAQQMPPMAPPAPGMMPPAPPTGGLPPLAPPTGMPPAMPMAAADMNMPAEALGDENVDSVEGIDTTTPEGMVHQSIIDIQSAIEMAKEGGTNLDKNDLQVLSDIADMIKTNLDKASGKAAPLGDMESPPEEGMAAPEGPPIGDQAMMMGAAPDMGSMPPATPPAPMAMPNESYVYSEAVTGDSFNFDNVRLAWGQVQVDAGKQKGIFSCQKEQPYDPSRFWSIFSHPEDETYVMVQRLAVTQDGKIDGPPVLDAKGRPVYKTVRKVVRKPVVDYIAPGLPRKSVFVNKETGREWEKHILIAPMKGVKGVRSDPATHKNVYKNIETGEFHSQPKVVSPTLSFHKPNQPQPGVLASKNLLTKVNDWKPFIDSDNQLSLSQSIGVSEACFNMKMIERMIYCGWIKPDYINTFFVKLEKDKHLSKHHAADEYFKIPCYINKASLGKYNYNLAKKEKELTDMKSQVIDELNQYVEAILDPENKFGTYAKNLAKDLEGKMANFDSDEVGATSAFKRLMFAMVNRHKVQDIAKSISPEAMRLVDEKERSIPQLIEKIKREENIPLHLDNAIMLVDNEVCDAAGFSHPQLVAGQAPDLPTFKAGEDIIGYGDDEEEDVETIVERRMKVIKKLYPAKKYPREEYIGPDPDNPDKTKLLPDHIKIRVKTLAGKDGLKKKVYLVINQKTGQPVMPLKVYIPYTGDPAKDKDIKDLNNAYSSATNFEYDQLVKKLKDVDALKDVNKLFKTVSGEESKQKELEKLSDPFFYRDYPNYPAFMRELTDMVGAQKPDESKEEFENRKKKASDALAKKYELGIYSPAYATVLATDPEDEFVWSPQYDEDSPLLRSQEAGTVKVTAGPSLTRPDMTQPEEMKSPAPARTKEKKPKKQKTKIASKKVADTSSTTPQEEPTIPEFKTEEEAWEAVQNYEATIKNILDQMDELRKSIRPQNDEDSKYLKMQTAFVKDLKEKNPTAGYDEIYKAPQYLELQKQRDAIEKEIAPTKAKIDALKKRPEVEKLNRLQTAWTTLWRAKKEKEKAQEDKGE